MRDTARVMKVISMNVGLPRDLLSGDRTIETGIIKTPIPGPVRVRALNLDGDRQADLTVHGGIDKAVYLYPSEHYDFWQQALGQELPWGAFGENLTVTGLEEKSISIGDHLGIATAVLAVSQPRLPCFKLAAKFQRDDMIQRFLDSRRTGFYARFLHEGEPKAGDTIVVIHENPARVTNREITDLYLTKHPERSRVNRVLSVDGLAASWRSHFLSVLAHENTSPS
jgi:MOSC domain-containing protein YiiM